LDQGLRGQGLFKVFLLLWPRHVFLAGRLQQPSSTPRADRPLRVEFRARGEGGPNRLGIGWRPAEIFLENFGYCLFGAAPSAGEEK